MKLTAMTDYALRLLMHVAAQPPQRRCTIAEVAQHHGVPKAHLMKITQQLALAGYLDTLRGKGGGIALARPASAIRLGDVVREVEGSFALVECFAGGAQCRLSGRCRLATAFGQALAGFMAELDRWTLQDVLPTASAATPARASIVKVTP